MADKSIVIPASGNPGDTHVRNGDRVSWQSSSTWNVGFTDTPFRQAGGPQSIPVPGGGSSAWAVVAGRPGTYPYSVAAGATASDPNIIVDPPPGG